MNILLLIIIGVLSLLLFFEISKQREQKQAILYLAERIGEITEENTQEYLMLTAASKEIKIFMESLNRLLEKHYHNQAAYRQTRQQMKQVLTNISHDIKTPLTVISGYTEILQEQTQKFPVPEEMTQLIKKLSAKTCATVRLVTQFFQIAKIESGDMIFDLKRTNLCACCRDFILDYYDILEQKHIQADIQIPDTPLYAKADLQALERIIKNLIDNALLYGSDGHYIGFFLREGDEHFFIEVEDHGKGIPFEQQQFIFHRDYFIDKKSNGNGLGLAIAERLAEAMGGTLSVFSVPGEKAVFTLRLKK